MSFFEVKKEKAHDHIVCSNCGNVLYRSFWDLMADCNYINDISDNKYLEIIAELILGIYVNVGDYNIKLINDSNKLLELARKEILEREED